MYCETCQQIKPPHDLFRNKFLREIGRMAGSISTDLLADGEKESGIRARKISELAFELAENFVIIGKENDE